MEINTLIPKQVMSTLKTMEVGKKKATSKDQKEIKENKVLREHLVKMVKMVNL